MLENILGRMPAYLIIFCAMLTMVIPFTIYMFNGFLHKKGDPQWKEKAKKEKKSGEKSSKKKDKKGKG